MEEKESENIILTNNANSDYLHSLLKSNNILEEIRENS